MVRVRASLDRNGRAIALSSATLVAACTSLVGVVPSDVPDVDARVDAAAVAPDGDGAARCPAPVPGYPSGDRDFTLRQPIDPRIYNFVVTGAGQDADGRVYVFGAMPDCHGPGGTLDAAVIRVNEVGGLDPTFGANGMACAPREAGDRGPEVPYAFGVDPRGRVVLAGMYTAPSSGARPVPFVARFDPAGQPDPSLGRGGALRLASAALAGEGGAALALRVEDDGVVLVGAQRPPADDSGYGFVTRLLEDGRPDPGFNGGEVWVDRTSWAFSAVASDGRGYAVAGATRDGHHPTVVKLGRDGRPETAFGRDGVALDRRLALDVRGLALDRRGGLLLAGGIPGDARGVMVRLDAQGAPDGDFGDREGLAYLNVPWNPAFQLSTLLTTQCDGRLVVASNAEESGFRLVRLDPDGRRDARFGEGGMVRQGQILETGSVRVFASLVSPRDGRITVVTSWRGDRDIGLWRFWP